MNNTIPKINFSGKARVSKQETPKQTAMGKINEGDVKDIIHKTTTPGFRKFVLGVTSFAAVMFATRRLAITPARKILYKAYPKSEKAVQNFVDNLRPNLAEIGSNLTKEARKIVAGKKLSTFTHRAAKTDAGAENIIKNVTKVVKYLGGKAKKITNKGLKNHNDIIDYTLAGAVAFLSSKGVIKFDNLSSKKKLEELLGDEKKSGKEVR